MANNRKGREGTLWDEVKHYIDPEVYGGNILMHTIYFEMNFLKNDEMIGVWRGRQVSGGPTMDNGWMDN